MKKGLRRLLAFLPLLIAVPLVLLLVSNLLGQRVSREGLNMAADAIRRAAVSCYALEGFYPSKLTYLEERYGVSINYDRYWVDYRFVASNLMPDVTVLPADR